MSSTTSPEQAAPLPPDHGDYYAGEHDLAYRLLANAGLAPDFLLLRREILSELAQTRAFIRAAVRRRQRLLEQLGRAPLHEIPRLHREAWDGWYASVSTFREQVEAINVKIQIFNLKNKIPNLYHPPVNADDEIRQAEAEA
ncbi:MAG: hypothetical protein Q9O62_14210 [Ardenticatenia bacterium]|nr:hypothetical protein [Ardenticatenia bacterium]